MRFFAAAAIAASLLAPGPAVAEPASRESLARAAEQIRELVQATRSVPGAPPAIAVIAVAEGSEPLILVSGTADQRTGAPADRDTPFYIASMTKAYVGLLAAELDRRNILDLDDRLVSHWPDLRIPGVDISTFTLRDLLTHRLPIRNSTLTFRTSFTDAVPAPDYPAILAAHSQPREPGFAYDNLGYLIYAAVLETKTGRPWQDWLADIVLRPAGLTRTSARTSEFPAAAAAHQWDGANWHVMRVKPDSIMHAAGGLVTSPGDMARWLQLQVSRPARGIDRRSILHAQTAVAHASNDRNSLTCDGYALGWNRCSFQGRVLLEHGGSYRGFRSHMMVMPDAQVGFAVLTNSDSMTGGLSTDLMMHFLKALVDPAAPGPDVQAFARDYAAKVERQAAGRASLEGRERGDPRWQGWAWSPTPEELASYAGRYHSDRLGDLVVRHESGQLTATLGEMRFSLSPAARDLFAGSLNPFEPKEPITFQRSASGEPDLLLWGERPFRRVR
jgi:CubicO group peptidase (beta-lactamase class C family)